ncbi:MAG: zinc-dependent alcohol dehydrogenase family protein [Methylocella sp.]
MSRVVRFHATGSPDVLRIEDVAIAPPRKDEVRIREKAIGLNRAESMFRSGQYIEDPKLPAGLGYEAAGEIESIGEGVEGFAIGDAVSVAPAFSLNAYGLYGELVLAPAFAVIKHPKSLSFAEAAATWMMYLTAYGALIETAKLFAGDTILIPAASSSVGIAAIQLANMVGAIPVALTRSAAKKAKLLELGAADVIVTTEQDIVAETLRITNGRGARVVFDPVGGPTLAKLTPSMTMHGILVLYGALNAESTPLPVLDLLANRLTIQAYVLLDTTRDPARFEASKKFVVHGLATGALKPVIAKTFPLDQIVEAHRYLESNQQIGKVVVTV